VRNRVDVFDGLRGIAIVLVVLSHTWILVAKPHSEVLRILFSSGNYAVSIFFVVGGFLATRGMLRQLENTGSLRFGVIFARRWIRLSSQVYPLVITVLALTAIDTNMAAYRLNDTRESAFRIVTYTWNGYVRTHAFEARPDLGHLWYVCTDLWVIALILLLVFMLGRRRWALFSALAACTLLVMIYREHVYNGPNGEFVALISVQTRADGLLWGAMAAVALPWVRVLADDAARVGTAAVVALVPLMWAVNSDARYFSLAGWALNVTLSLFVMSMSIAPPARYVSIGLGWRPLVALGRYSLVIYIWHYPIFWYISRNTPDWLPGWRTLTGYLATLAIAVVAQWLIERPVQRWLRSEFWRPFDGGFLAGTRHHVVAQYGRLREARQATKSPDPTSVRDLTDQF
jgi:peptidoglycan/LPS O-acetylase OafA/YrhL